MGRGGGRYDGIYGVGGALRREGLGPVKAAEFPKRGTEPVLPPEPTEYERQAEKLREEFENKAGRP